MGFKKIDEFIQEADLKKNATPKKGRKKRSETYLAVYLSKEEKEKVNQYAEEQGVSASTLVRMLLKREGIL
ncbi:MAG: hypothetical protein DSY34_04195 [Desulfurobacterium sp.]|jgi:hypothetical protein|nr:MAG: hypothetical protein DSY34_04195 [Desulfurobacterium sp.]